MTNGDEQMHLQLRAFLAILFLCPTLRHRPPLSDNRHRHKILDDLIRNSIAIVEVHNIR